jgi:hypothetical protein
MHEPLPHRSAGATFAQHVLHRDIETRSRAILKSVGAHRYAANPSTEVLCIAYAVNHDPVQLWRPGDPVPPEFLQAALDPSWIVAAHNDVFESAIEERVLASQYGWPLIPIERHRCTMSMSLAAGLPARLSALADALELANRKDEAGERLMHQMSKPRRARQGEDPAGTCRRTCSGCSSCGSAEHRQPPERLIHCWHVPALMIACAVVSNSTARLLAAGPVKVSSRRI